MRVSSALSGLEPEVAPQITRVPPGRSDLTECDQVAAPTVSMTASTLSGTRSPVGTARCAPISSAWARFASSRLVAYTRSPADRPRRRGWRHRRLAGSPRGRYR